MTDDGPAELPTLAELGWDVDERGHVVNRPIPQDVLELLATVRSAGPPGTLYPIPIKTLVSLIDELLERRAW